MTDVASLITPVVAKPTADDDAYIILEQQQYSSNAGKVTMLDIVQALSERIIETEGPDVDCGLEPGGKSFSAIVYAYPSPASLAYKVDMTRGTFAPLGRVVVPMTEVLTYSLSDAASLAYPVHNVQSYDWLSDVYSDAGDVVGRPAVTRDGQEIHLDSPVYGSLSVTYRTMRDVYRVRVTERETAVQNVFQSVLYAVFAGGIVLLEVDAPPNAEENYLAGVDCSGFSPLGDGSFFGSSLDVVPDDDAYQPPDVDPKNIEITLDYCGDFGNDD